MFTGTEVEEADRIKNLSEALKCVAALEDYSQRVKNEPIRRKILELRTIMESSYIANTNNKQLTLLDMWKK